VVLLLQALPPRIPHPDSRVVGKLGQVIAW